MRFYAKLPVHVHETPLVAPRVERQTLRSADHDKGLSASVVERHRSDREGSLIVS